MASFITVSKTSKNGRNDTPALVNVEHIATVHIQGSQTVIGIIGSEYGVWCTESLETVTDLIREAGSDITQQR